MNTPTDKPALRAGPSGAATNTTEEVTRAVIETAPLRPQASIAEHAPRIGARSSNALVTCCSPACARQRPLVTSGYSRTRPWPSFAMAIIQLWLFERSSHTEPRLSEKYSAGRAVQFTLTKRLQFPLLPPSSALQASSA